MKARESELAGVVKLIFQPAEEGGAGADRMCNEGALHSPDVEQIFGLHVWPGVTTGPSRVTSASSSRQPAPSKSLSRGK
ncbi:MAG: hypothetical protein DMG01_24950, partial [Acidobacteria bacterium]